ncbi:exopolysaccharide biosynthesis polyprenyl glycosylphosphotransferase [Cellulomonas flavigena DSM 20109]|uniref:Exopolysaccharide biosynthesis polyprenyl glycosylphosphotransferase n=1 Tax=Cellulomonas flavigena (strain ATCC 482 / DSM 20109 / BCRC 11376 / JCM 18109 / NBRC 3775 / NCIMB 8073 / NRS 134) TaxID=446466 RepID=D5UJB7_CELFN|nr:sugar transferase [Cellulomonas flavigena]ADG73640.1 exopolysaccharide biosynthesis polyprenyl glycosylphosphotransferase [Cellulomonas flavigena DSM 20109]
MTAEHGATTHARAAARRRTGAPRDVPVTTPAAPPAPEAPPPHALRWDPARMHTRGPRRPVWLVRFHALLIANDTAVVVAATALGAWLWGGPRPVTFFGAPVPTVSWLAAVVAIWLVALAAVRSRSELILAVGVTELQRVLNASVFALAAVMSTAYLGDAQIPRGTLAGAFGSGLLGLMVTRLAWRHRLIAWRAGGRCKRNALLVGPHRDVVRLLGDLRRNHRAGFRVVGIALTDVDPAPDARIDDVETFGLEELVDRAHHPRVTSVVLAGDLPGGRAAIRRLGWSLEGAATELVLPSRLTYVAGPRIHLRPVEGMPLVHLSLPTYTGVAHVAKRGVDVVVASLALVVLLPALLAVAVAIKLDDGGPVLFRQERVGNREQLFTMYKFRTMVVDAEARLAALQERNQGAGVLFKMTDDPRVTRVGRVLRAWSLDELPQFLNALLGTMSVVGPRPPLPREVALYDGDVHRRLLSKPGITGLWQVSGRSDLTWEESVQLDLSYVENWSLSGDLMIILRTFRSVLARAGAY